MHCVYRVLAFLALPKLDCLHVLCNCFGQYIFFSLFLFCGEGIWISQCRHCFGLQAKRSVCAAHSIWLNIINRKNEEVPCGNEVTRLFLLISINAPLHKLVSWMADMLIRAGHCLSTLIIDKILGYQKANLRHI